MVDAADAIATELTWQMGRPVAQSPFEIRRGFQERARYMIDIAGDALADIALGPKEGFQRFIRREPLGVVLVLAPWNYPYLASVNAVVPALMAGNSVILKVSQQTPLVAERYAEAFREAGLPEGVFQRLQATHDGRCSDDWRWPHRLRLVHRLGRGRLRGSARGLQAVHRAPTWSSAARIPPTFGRMRSWRRRSKTSSTARTSTPASRAARSSASTSIVTSTDRFVDGFVALTRAYRLGNPLSPETTLGPMVRTGAADFVRAQIAEAASQGARPLIDSREFPADREGTPYLAPQVLVNVDHGMRVMTEETFGPVVGVMPVKDDDEAVELMNDSRYGLTASIWTSDVDAAIRIGDRVETGTWFLNRCDYLDPALAWTGVKDSGRGCSLSQLGYEALTRPEVVPPAFALVDWVLDGG